MIDLYIDEMEFTENQRSVGLQHTNVKFLNTYSWGYFKALCLFKNLQMSLICTYVNLQRPQ